MSSDTTKEAGSTTPSPPPAGIPYIIGNEAAERFSYYGMKAILVVFMTSYLKDSSGALAPMSEEDAKAWYHVFNSVNYFFPILGALIADIFWGKYRTIMYLSLVYCLGHFVLVMFETRFGLGVGLLLIAIGSGGIKPCVIAHVGDQFTARTSHWLEKTFGFFYLSINLGAFISTLLTPFLLEEFGPSVAFGLPGFFMLLATWFFYLGRKVFVAIPPVSWSEYSKSLYSASGKQALRSLSVLFLFISVFWSLFDQTGSSWVLQAKQMERRLNFCFGLWEDSRCSVELLPSQIQSLNPILILILVPIFTFIIYPFLRKRMALPLTFRIQAGMLLASLSFVVVGLAESRLQAGIPTSIVWQMLAYLILTSAEVLVSVTAYEFAYTQAPAKMKSLIMGLYLLSLSLGNLIAAGVNSFLSSTTTPLLEGAGYFYFFSLLMLLTTLTFYLSTRGYREQLFLHEE